MAESKGLNTKNLTLVILILILVGMGFIVFSQITSGPTVETAQPTDDDKHSVKKDIVLQEPAPEATVSTEPTDREPDPQPEPAPEPQPEPEESQTEPTVEQTAMAPEPEPGPTDPEIPQPQPVTPTPEPAPEKVAPAPKKPAAPKPEPTQTTKQKPAPAPKQSSTASSNEITSMKVAAGPNGLVLFILTTSPIEGYKYFTLASPKRAVLDLLGSWPKASPPSVPDNPAVKSLRSGLHDKYLRFVADLKPGASGEVVVEKISNTEIRATFK